MSKASKSNVQQRREAAQALIAAWKARGWTLGALAEACGTTLSAVVSWDNNGTPLSGADKLLEARAVTMRGGTMPHLGRAKVRPQAAVIPPPPPTEQASTGAQCIDSGSVQAVVELLLEAIPDAMLYAEVAKRAAKVGAA